MQPPPYKHTLDAFIRIMQEEGPRGFYRGLLPSLMGVSHVAVQFPLYETFKSWAREASGSNGEGGLGGADLPPRVILACSSSAKMIASVLTYPHEVVRTRLQMHPRTKAPKTATAAAAAAASGAQEGQSIRTSASSAAAGSDARRGYSTVASSSTSTHTIDTRRHNTSMTASTLSTGRSPSSFCPSSLRTRLQSTSSTTAAATPSAAAAAAAASEVPPQKYTSLLRTVGTIFREEGLRGFYNGMGVNLVRTVPSSALTILTYEVMMQHLTSGGGNGAKGDMEDSEQGTREER